MKVAVHTLQQIEKSEMYINVTEFGAQANLIIPNDKRSRIIRFVSEFLYEKLLGVTV